MSALDDRFAFLDALPDSFYTRIVGATGASLRERVQALDAWRNALLRGAVPDSKALTWPERRTQQRLVSEVERLGILHYCTGQPELVDALLTSLLDAMDADTREWAATVRQELSRLEAIERKRRQDAAKAAQAAEDAKRAAAAKGEQKVGGSFSGTSGSAMAKALESALTSRPAPPISPADLSPTDLARLREEAEKLADGAATASMHKRLQDVWAERIKVWQALAEIFGELGNVLGLGWDLSLGVLKSQGWLELARLRKLLEQVPQLKALVRTLGRLVPREGTADEIQISQVLSKVRRLEDIPIEVRSPHAPTETRGITRSGDIARMLPSEAVLLAHPKLRLLWHARRAERALITYQVEGVFTEMAQVEREGTESRPEEQRKPRPEKGPIMVCLDTSGSMAGVPEAVAKALTLEAMRVAHTERRQCLLYNFSGPGQVYEHTLSMTPEGLTGLLTFLIQSFQGGTDVQEPLNRALKRLNHEQWARADILMVSDGEFGVPDDIRKRVGEAREKQGLRVHGVLIGNSSDAAMKLLCAPLHRFTSWKVLGEETTPKVR